jgi:hypothetical protein
LTKIIHLDEAVTRADRQGDETIRTLLQTEEAAGRHVRGWCGTVWIIEVQPLAWLGICADRRKSDLHGDLARCQVVSVNDLDFELDAVGEL